jgi:hypothetical protein
MIMNNIKIAKKKPIEIVPVPTNIDNEPPTAMEVPSMPAPNATGITASGNITAPILRRHRSNTIITTKIKKYEILNNDNYVGYVCCKRGRKCCVCYRRVH